MATAFHSKYWASELTLRAATGTIESISRSIAGARVDLNSDARRDELPGRSEKEGYRCRTQTPLFAILWRLP